MGIRGEREKEETIDERLARNEVRMKEAKKKNVEKKTRNLKKKEKNSHRNRQT